MTKKLLIALMTLGVLSACKMSQQSMTTTTSEKGNNEATMKQMPQGRLLLVRYNFQGMALEQIRNITLKRTDGQPVIHFEYINEERQYAVADSLFDLARAIIEEEKMYQYQSFYRWDSDEKILDGYSWSFEALFEGDQHISTRGSNVSPDGKGLSRIRGLLEQTARSLVRSEEGGE